MAAAICCGVPPETLKALRLQRTAQAGVGSARLTSGQPLGSSRRVPGGATRPFQVGTESVAMPLS